MKMILALSILLCAAAMPASGALTESDLDKIRLIVKEEVKKEITPLITDINTLKTEGAIRQTEIENVKEKIDTGFGNVQKDFDDIQKKLTDKITLSLPVLVSLWRFLRSVRLCGHLSTQAEREGSRPRKTG